MHFKLILAWLIFSFSVLSNVPKPVGFVLDQAEVLNPVHRQAMQRAAIKLKKQTGIDFAVLTLKSLDGEPIEQKAVRIFEAWGLGEKNKDTGILMLIVPNEKQIRFEIGYGLEDVLPDARVGRLLDQAVLPYFKQQKISEGVLSAYKAALAILAEHYAFQLPSSAPITTRSQVSEPQAVLLLPVLLLIACLLPFRWGRRLLYYSLIALMFSSSRGRSRTHFGSFGVGGFGGFGGGLSGGGGASRSW